MIKKEKEEKFYVNRLFFSNFDYKKQKQKYNYEEEEE